MKKNIFPSKKGTKDLLLRSFLVISIIFSIVIVNNCDFLTNFIDALDNGGGGIGPGNSTTSETITALFKSASEGAISGVSGAATTWALGALGLSDESPNYTEQLNKIREGLQEVISRLNAVQDQLSEINNQLLQLDCSAQQTALTEQTGRIQHLTTLYRSYIADAANGGKVSNTKLNDWADDVLADGEYKNRTPMGQILTTIANQLLQPSSGAITACVKAVAQPEDNSFNDIPYYNKVNQFTDYYYYYQAEGLYLLNEALHYKAWSVAASENDDNYSADSVSNVCSNRDASIYCTQVGAYTNTVYNALVDQFTVAGAPYQKDGLLMMNNKTNGYLWPLSLEDFQTAGNNPNNCSQPLTSEKPCGKRIVLQWWQGDNYTSWPMKNVNYEGYTGWATANMDLWAIVFSGWRTRTAGHYLESTFGFKNMNNKIIIGHTEVRIHLTNSGADEWVVPFFDTDFDHSLLPGAPAMTSSQFDRLVRKDARNGALCKFGTHYRQYDYNTASGLPSNRNGWYNMSAYSRRCGSNYTTPFKYTEYPGWAAEDNDGKHFGDIYHPEFKQFRWPVLSVANIACTLNRSNKNPGGVWTMCGNNFTTWLETIVPRPEACDLNVGVACKL